MPWKVFLLTLEVSFEPSWKRGLRCISFYEMISFFGSNTSEMLVIIKEPE